MYIYLSDELRAEAMKKAFMDITSDGYLWAFVWGEGATSANNTKFKFKMSSLPGKVEATAPLIIPVEGNSEIVGLRIQSSSSDTSATLLATVMLDKPIRIATDGILTISTLTLALSGGSN